jgi:hypothetical protein
MEERPDWQAANCPLPFISAPQSAGNTAKIHAVMLEKSAVFRDGNRLDEMRRQIVKRNGFAPAVAFRRERA